MKILAVRGENLASLAREFDIEFGDGPLASAGVFAIVGPTGAGKSTLLDAICVALFDRTPRLGNRSTVQIGRGDDIVKLGAHDVRTILRRGASRGWAEVDFEGVDGRRYRSRWEVWRARGGASGRLQDQRITLTCLDTAERIGGTKTETLDAIRARLGLKFEQFCRSALLAQGEFAAFLRADAADRADLLERMTGTEIYGELSMAAFRRAAVIEVALREQRAALGAIVPLADEARAALIASREVDAAAVVDARHRRDALAARAAWVVQRGDHGRAIAAAQADHAAAGRDWIAAAGTRAQLEDAQRAEAIRPAWDERGRAVAAARPAAAAVGAAAAAITAAIGARDAAGAERAALDEVLGRARVIRTRAGLAPAEAAATPVRGGRDGAAIDRRQIDRREFDRAAIDGELVTLAAALAALDDRRRDAAAAVTTARGEVQKAEVDSRRYEAARRKAPVEAARRTLRAAERDLAGAKQLVATVGVARNAAADETAAVARRADHVAALATLRAEAGSATAAAAEARVRFDEARAGLDRLVTAAALDHHRSQLVDGEACPLCGATAHPWAGRGAVDALIDTERRRAGKLQQAIERAVGDAARTAQAIATTEAAIEQLDAGRAAAAAHLEAATLEFRAALATLGELPWSDDPASDAAQRLATDRAARALAAYERADAAHQTAAAADQAAKEAVTVVLGRRAEVEHAIGHGQAVEADAAALAGALHAVEAELFATRAAADAEVHAGERTVAGAEASAAAARDTAARADARLRDAIAAVAAAVSGAELDEVRVTAHMARPAAWVDTTRRALASLSERQARAAAVVDERTRLLAAHDAARPALADEPVDLAATLAGAGAAVAELERAITIAGEQLRADAVAHQRRAAAAGELDHAEAIARVDRVLAELIGSHDGKTFRSFAQSLTLDALLIVANDHLHGLAPRYQLERVPDHDLELQIVDRDLGDEVRSVSSLSGGESFLVSLALALALSSVSARNVRVRTLLIDEGFGTLDPSALDTALSVLDALHATGCQVGIISHVPGLIERVGAHVVVRPLGGGRSSIEVRAAG